MGIGNAAFGGVWEESWGRLVVSCPEDWLGFFGCYACEGPGDFKVFWCYRKRFRDLILFF
jgi:hypothetical protein